MSSGAWVGGFGGMVGGDGFGHEVRTTSARERRIRCSMHVNDSSMSRAAALGSNCALTKREDRKEVKPPID